MDSSNAINAFTPYTRADLDFNAVATILDSATSSFVAFAFFAPLV